MRGEHAFCPSSGALLAEQRERPGYLPTTAPVRAPEPDAFNEAPVEPYTCGANFSSASALVGYFRRMATKHGVDEPGMERQAALAIKRLKEPEKDLHDDYLWYALAERLMRKGGYSRDELGWMQLCVQVGCPACYQKLKFERDAVDGRMLGKCSKHCATGGHYVNRRIRELIRKGYNRSFCGADNTPEIEELRYLDRL